MTYFNNVKTLDELRKQYKELLKKFHPDNPNGSTEVLFSTLNDAPFFTLNGTVSA